MEPGETQEACIVREIREETFLEVQVERLLFETEDPQRSYGYQKYATYLCMWVSGEAAPGSENENSAVHSITGAGWYPLWDEDQWEAGFYEAHIYPLLVAVRNAL